MCIGSTLWSYIPKEHMDAISDMMNDYNLIKEFTVEKSTQMFDENVDFLTKTIDKYKDEYTLIILTHHSPLLKNTSDKKFENTRKGSVCDQTPRGWVAGEIRP